MIKLKKKKKFKYENVII